MSENERFAVFSFILKSLTRFCNLKLSSLANLANPGFARITLSKKGVSMQYFIVQFGLTVFFTLLRWTFIWTKTMENNLSWPIVNNLFFVVVISWLFTLGYFVKSRQEENLKKKLKEVRGDLSDWQNEYKRLEDLLNSKIKELAKEKERFFVLLEKMVDGVGMRKAEFPISREDQAVLDSERAAVTGFLTQGG